MRALFFFAFSVSSFGNSGNFTELKFIQVVNGLSVINIS